MRPKGVLDALASLELQLYPFGEEAMMRVEKSWPPAWREVVTGPAEPGLLTAQGLRDALQRIEGI